MTQLPVCDFGEVIDPPTEDVTAHVVEALVAVRRARATTPRSAAASPTCWREQRPDGSWWGRWGVNHIYGTGAVLPALAAAGEDMAAPARRAARSTGSPTARTPTAAGASASRATATRRGSAAGDSTASQTAWALLALLAADPDHPAVAGGVRLPGASTQPPDGDWDEDAFTGTGFPGDFMIKLPPLPPVLPAHRARAGTCA